MILQISPLFLSLILVNATGIFLLLPLSLSPYLLLLLLSLYHFLMLLLTPCYFIVSLSVAAFFYNWWFSRILSHLHFFYHQRHCFSFFWSCRTGQREVIANSRERREQWFLKKIHPSPNPEPSDFLIPKQLNVLSEKQAFENANIKNRTVHSPCWGLSILSYFTLRTY